MGTLQYGAHQAIYNCMRIRPNDRLVIITDRGTEHIARALREEARQITPCIKVYTMEDYGERGGEVPLAFPAEIGDALAGATASIYAADGKAGELQSFRMPMIGAVRGAGLRHGHMPGVTTQMMETGMAADYNEIHDLSVRLQRIMEPASYARVTTPAGTDFTANFGYRWKRSDGRITAKHWSNLPDGEIFTCVTDANGTIVVDGVLGDHFDVKYGPIAETPLVLTVRDGRVVNSYCANPQLLADIRQYMQMDENANRIGEWAIGTNIGLDALVGRMLQDEKFPGVHIALGDGYPDKTGSTWSSNAHCDGVLLRPTIEVGKRGRVVMQDGKFCI